MFVMVDGGAMVDGQVPFVFDLSVLLQMCEGDFGRETWGWWEDVEEGTCGESKQEN